jgi:hypothetical protein
MPVDGPLAETYQLLGEMQSLITGAQGSGCLAGFLQQADGEEWSTELDGIRFRVVAYRPLAEGRVPGSALLIALGAQEYVMVGRNLQLTIRPTDPAAHCAEFIYLDTGAFTAGAWQSLRRLNGDESQHGSGFTLNDALQVYRFKVHCF